jgi:hypothetical protein
MAREWGVLASLPAVLRDTEMQSDPQDYYHLPTEADLLCELYHQAKTAGMRIRMETRVPSAVHRSGYLRADAAIMLNNAPVILIEAKTPGSQLPKPESRQHRAYASTGLPVFYLNDFAQIPRVVQDCLWHVRRYQEALR